nr:dTDP-4-dehydrorhamnose 3,5-epimerase family protein [Porticoccaceae bacterium]
MKIIASNIPDVLIFEPTVYNDDRGYFMETWRQSVFDERGLNTTFVQDNHSKSNRGTLRGLHYQLSHPQGKLARVISGEVFDVAVDLRK